ncbi:MAG TPA: DUF3500 domain-containing protein, partial [Bryobacteraceae bacterium]
MKTASAMRACAWICLTISSAAAQTVSSRIATSANAFLATLDQKQRQTVLFAFDDEAQRARWSNLPTTMVRRGGLPMRDLTAPQRSAAMALVAAVLSRRGFEKV